MSGETDPIWNEELGKVEDVGWSFTGRIDLPQPEGVWSDQQAKNTSKLKRSQSAKKRGFMLWIKGYHRVTQYPLMMRLSNNALPSN